MLSAEAGDRRPREGPTGEPQEEGCLVHGLLERVAQEADGKEEVVAVAPMRGDQMGSERGRVGGLGTAMTTAPGREGERSLAAEGSDQVGVGSQRCEGFVGVAPAPREGSEGERVQRSSWSVFPPRS